jgi:two-component system, OmpR family, phosphate regulon sensor histidine kinase PhoR
VHLPPRGIVELNETCAFVIQTLEPLAEPSLVTVTFNRLPSPALIRGERDEIVQVFQNLLQNAIKYGHEGGRVDVSLTREPARGSGRDRLAVTIADNGPGIAPEHLPRLTERFYRASVSSSREKGGTGLGLAIVKHIVNRHRGLLRIQSTVGTGSTFTVIFDALGADRPPPQPKNEKISANTMDNIVTK